MKPLAFNRSRRRVYVMLYSFALFFLYPLLQEHLPIIAFGLFLSLSPLYWWSGRVMLALFNYEPLDERDRQVATTGMTHAYWILAMSLLLSVGMGVFDGYLWGPMEQFNRYFLMNDDVLLEFWTLLLVTVVLPACIVAWLEPNPLPEEHNDTRKRTPA